MNHVMICSLKRGVIDPPEPLSCIEQKCVIAGTRVIQEEWDPRLTQREWMQEEGWRHDYPRKLARKL